MEPTYSLKRERPLEYSLCIICQETKKETLRSTDTGLSTLINSANLRQTFKDPQNRTSIENIISSTHNKAESLMKWHKTCYSTFTSKWHIDRLKQSKTTVTSSCSNSSGEQPSTSTRSTRSFIGNAIDWDMCMFCQSHTEEKLHQVLTFKTSQDILEHSQFDQVLRVRFSTVNDLIATEGKYHLRCYSRCKRDYVKAKQIPPKSLNLPMLWLATELRDSAKKGYVFELSEVFKRYCTVCDTAETSVPLSFISRIASFGEKLQPCVSDCYEFISIQNKRTVLVPLEFQNATLFKLINENNEEDSPINVYHSDDDFLEMAHVALKLRSDILKHPKYNGFEVNENQMIDTVPESVYMFIRLLLGGQALLENDVNDEEISISSRESQTQLKVLSIAQDLVYNVSGGKQWTPKHLGIASTIHQATRSKVLVEMLHNAGHSLSYDNILQIDTALAEKTLHSMDPDTGAIVPPNLVPDRFVHFTCDNIDINDSTFDGKNTFHATQLAAWQRGPASDIGLKNMKPANSKALEVPEIMNEIFPADIPEGKMEPKSTDNTKREWFERNEENVEAKKARAMDMAFVINRQNDNETKKGWTYFNQIYQTCNQEMSSIGFMPIIQATAGDMDTLNTVIIRCKHVATSLCQNHVVLTVDEALFPKLMELKWTNALYKDTLVVRLGGLHISMNFLKVIGQHMQSSGLQELWTENDILGPRAAEQVMVGKHYSRGMRVHKLTWQALWKILLPKVLDYIEAKNADMRLQLDTRQYDPDYILNVVSSSEFSQYFEDYIKSKENPNFRFWFHYLEMVQILLLFIRAQREGNWKLHLYAFREMIPYFMRYDHTNYARWGIIYLNEMNQLPPEVEREFDKGNFVVKMSNNNFSQVDPDQCQEWLNGIGKKNGGIVGITKTQSALSRWALSFNLRSNISRYTKDVYGLCHDGEHSHNETSKSRIKRDNIDENTLYESLYGLNMFNDNEPENLQSIFSKDLTTEEIELELLGANEKGQKQLMDFVDQRILPIDESQKKFHDPLPKNKPKTFSTLYEISRNDQGKQNANPIKADRRILQRLITAYDAHREVNLDNILCHELLPVPISLAYMNGTLRSASKSILIEELHDGIPCPTTLTERDLGQYPTLIIDGMALVISLGKPHGVATFGDFADHLLNSVLQSASNYQRIDVLFDRYDAVSIKSGTRSKRASNTVPVRRPIEGKDVPFPTNMNNFLAHPDNKADLTNFLSQYLIANTPADKLIVTGGGFRTGERVEASTTDINLECLEANHEEADTRIVVHCIESQSSTIVVAARDTDILLLLMAHFHRIPCTKIWLKSGTSKKRKYIPIHGIVEKLQLSPDVLESVVAFHALTGSDTTSYFAMHSKKTCWKVFLENPILLKNLGICELSSDTVQGAEKFVCRIYDCPNFETTNKARTHLFIKSKTTESLPPTSDALLFHIKRSHYQASVWRQAYKLKPLLQSTSEMGWKLHNGVLVPILKSLPSVPESCIELTSCSCQTHCASGRCKCRKVGQPCTAACKCREESDTCFNF